MTARILVVDDSGESVKLLQRKLTSEYLEVITALDGAEALAKIAEFPPDIVLVDAMMPGIDGFEVCRRIKASPNTTHLPVVMVTALDQPADRVAALEAGADEFLTKPFEPIAFMALVRSLIRRKMVVDELRLSERTGHEVGIELLEDAIPNASASAAGGQILLIEDKKEVSDAIWVALSPRHAVYVEKDAEDALLLVRRAELDLIVVDLSLSNADGLRVCSRLRTIEEARRIPLLAIAAEADSEARVRALDIGVNGFIAPPFHRGELLARVAAQLRRKRYSDDLRRHLRASLEQAVVDPLTGMNNRRYLDGHLRALVAQNVQRGRPVSVLIVDIDHFKAVNDNYGHETGDEVLREVASRMSASLRGLDLCCRFGGEEFVAAFSGGGTEMAVSIAERLRLTIADEPFAISTEKEKDSLLAVTISIGIATTLGADDTAEALLKRADLALYRAKKEGRNRVVVCAQGG
jgi:two-component system, cell cycle response regulator